MAEKEIQNSQVPCDPMEHIRIKYPDTYKVFAQNCMVIDVGRSLTRKPRVQKNASDRVAAEFEKAHADNKYPHGQLFVVPMPSAINIDFHFMDDHDTRNKKMGLFWDIIKRHYFGCNPFHLPEGKPVTIVNALGERTEAIRKELKVETDSGLVFQIDDKYRPSYARVVLAHTNDSAFHERVPKTGGAITSAKVKTASAKVKTGGCNYCPDRRCDFAHLSECLEKFIVPALAKAIALRQLVPNHPNPFQHAD